MTDLLIGIDVGTFETKGVLVDASGSVRARARIRHDIQTPRPGWIEHDADGVWWHDVVGCSRELMRSVGDGDRVVAMGCSAIGPCVLPIDEELRPLRAGILYGADTRAHEQVDELTARLGEDEILRRSGNTLSSQSAGPKILWIRQNEPEVAERTRWYVTSQSYVVARLTGEVVIDHATAGYFHPLYDLAGGRWNVDGLSDVVRGEQLPRIAWAGEIVGSVTSAASAETGIPRGTPVIAGTADAPAEAIAASVVSPGDTMLMCGSSSFMIRVTDAPLAQRVLWSAPFVFEGMHVAAAGTATAGTATRWICDLLGLDARDDDAVFGELVALAGQSPPGAGGVLMLPHLSGERTPVHDPDARGAFSGLGLATSRADIARALIEGVAHSIARALGAYDAAGIPPERLVAIGGGTKNAILLQTVSDIIGAPLQIADTDGAALGDAALAALASGVLSSPAEVAAWVRLRGTVEPGGDDAPAVRTLRADHDDHRRLYEALAPIDHARSTRR
ncbi:FGGY-family carbohydrate kinase [Microbacterium sp. G2-8]|uniref:FGGY-family carbohydrate kinase n=1 Tax=Microbacterium sp. G2-8 TaxID=2842454 RepID=UPI001C8A4405|nr:FGGY family carbohydrate kinase [Microbacterium sp. G2-8]